MAAKRHNNKTTITKHKTNIQTNEPHSTQYIHIATYNSSRYVAQSHLAILTLLCPLSAAAVERAHNAACGVQVEFRLFHSEWSVT